MSTDRETLAMIGEWLEEGRTRLPDHVVDAMLDQLPSRPQRRSPWQARREADVRALSRYAIAAVAVAVVAIAGLNLVGPPSWGATATVPPPASVTPTASSTVSPRPSSSASPRPKLPVGRPGTTFSPAGDYGFEGGIWWAHRVIEDEQPAREATELLFTVGAGCLDTSDAVTVPVTVAGFHGVVIEPYEHDLARGTWSADEIRRGYALTVGDRTLCAFITWHPTTTDDEIRSAAQVLDTLRAEPVGRDRLRVSFFLPEGWDTG